MRDLTIHQQKENNLPSLGILTHITEVTRYDYIYIYNLIKPGDTLFLKKDFQRTWDKDSLAVYYKGYKLGYIGNSIKKILSKYFDQQKGIEIMVQHVPNSINNRKLYLDILINIH